VARRGLSPGCSPPVWPGLCAMNAPARSLAFGSFTLDAAERLLLKDGRVVPLTPKAFDLLAVMVANAGRLLSKDELIKEVWPDAFVEESNLAYNVFTIRKALGEVEADRYIQTVPRRGYRFVAPVTLIEAGASDLVSPSNPHLGADLHVEQAGAQPSIQALAAETAVRPALERDPGPAPNRARLAWTVATASSIALAGLAFIQFHAKPESLVGGHFQIPVPIELIESNPFSISPDGRYLAFTGAGTDGIVRLWVRSLNALDARRVSGTDSKVSNIPPFWSPDSGFIAYDAGGQLMKVSVSGGAPQVVCQLKGPAVGGAWYDDVMLVGNAAGGLIKCPASGGAASSVTSPSSTAEHEIDLFPSFLPDGQHFLYSRIPRTAPENSGVFVGSVADDAPRHTKQRLLATGFGAVYIGSRNSAPGQILFMRDDVLYTQSFDDRRLALAGDAVPVAAPVGSFLDYAFFSVSASGVLVFKAPDPDIQLTWFDRKGEVTGLVGAPGRYSGVALSPDATHAVAVKHAPHTTVDQDLWLFELSHDAKPRRLTFDSRLEFSPVWDGRDHIVFATGGGPSGVYEMSIHDDKRPRLLFQTRGTEFLASVSRDSRILLYGGMGTNQTSSDLWGYPLGGDGIVEPRPFLSREFDQEQGQFSPDGRWAAYVSNESGPREVFVASSSLDAATGSAHAGPGTQVSKGGGTSPRWRGNGRELFYLASDGTVMAVEVSTDRGFEAGTPTPLFRVAGLTRTVAAGPAALADWGVSPDGNRFLLAVPVSSPPPFDVILNWQVGVKR
jgi:DNA-binding winged helix-turn-helix (wHTH) protein/WD40 repeat protein